MNARVARVEGNVVRLRLEPPPSRRSLEQLLDDADEAAARAEDAHRAYRASLRPQRAADRDVWGLPREPSENDGAWEVVLWTMAVLLVGAVVGLALSVLMRSPG